MSAQETLRRILEDRLGSSRSRRPLFSMRAFSRRIGISSSALSEILKGKRRVSPKLAHRIVTGLDLPKLESEKILTRFRFEAEAGVRDEETKRIELDETRFAVVAHWIHFAILSLMETKDFKQDISWIATRLSVSETEVSDAIQRLFSVEMLTSSSDGRWMISSVPFRTTDRIRSLALQQAQSRNLELANRSLMNDPIRTHDFSATTMAIDPSRIPTAIKMIREFQDRLCEFLEAGNRTEVYKMCAQLFPLTAVSREESDQ